MIDKKEIIKKYGFDPDSIGVRPRGWDILEDGTLNICARDGGSNKIDVDAYKVGNCIGNHEDDFDCTYRYYQYRPLLDDKETT